MQCISARLPCAQRRPAQQTRKLPAWGAATLLLALAPAFPSWSASRSDSDAPVLAPITVTGNPLGDEVVALPSTVVQADELDLRKAGTLGETLDGLPGVSKTSYGPMVGRPIIRGMDGDRIRLLQNGVGGLDASSLSYDHALAQDPLSSERVEILRGPAALMYGANAVGGVVNVIDNRIPAEPLEGVHGELQGRYGGASLDRSGAVQVEAGDGRYALHADAFGRKTGELRIPGHARSAGRRAADGARPQPHGHLPNSDGAASGGALGMSWTGEAGHAGLSYSGYDSDYGSVAEESVRIRMHQRRLGLSAEARDLGGFFSRIGVRAAYTDYRHKEIEDGRTGTTFTNRGYEARLEAQHAALGPVRGVLGMQFAGTRFAALGDEALVPTTATDSAAVFVLEEWTVDDRLRLSAGGRFDYTRLSPSAGGRQRFTGLPGRDFAAKSFSVGGVYTLGQAWSLTANAAYTERTPTFYELYADGPHEATGQYLVGDAGLGKERAYSSDLSLRFRRGHHRGSVSLFYTRFANYLAELGTGRFRNDEGDVVAGDDDEALPEARYEAVPAEFFGFEAAGSFRVYDQSGHALDLRLSGDYTRARNRATGAALPRIPALRLGVGLEYRKGAWSAGVDLTRAFAQHHRPATEAATAAYDRLDAHAAYRFKIDGTQWQVYLRGTNLTNQTIRQATSVLRDVAPEGGRAVMAGVRGRF